MIARKVLFILMLICSVSCYGLDNSENVLPNAYSMWTCCLSDQGTHENVYTADQCRVMAQYLSLCCVNNNGYVVGGQYIGVPEIGSAMQEYLRSPEYMARVFAYQEQLAMQQQQDALRQSEEKKQAEEKVAFARQQHAQEYGVSYETLHGSRNVRGWYQRRDYNKVKDFILLSQKKLTKQQALNIWDGYCKDRVIGTQKKIDGRLCIAQEFDRRENQERVKQEAQATVALPHTNSEVSCQSEVVAGVNVGDIDLCMKDPEPCIMHEYKDCACCVKLPRDFESLQQEYENIPLFCDESMPIEQQGRVQQRQKALDQTKIENYLQYEKSYSLSASTEGYLRLQEFDISDYQQLFGTALQQVLHGEMCKVVEQAAQAMRTMPYPSQLLMNATNFADAACEVNKAEFVKMTCVLADLAWQYAILPNLVYAEYGAAVTSGVIQGFAGLAHMSRHPFETGKALGKAMLFAVETFGLMQVHATHPDQVAPLLQERGELVCGGIAVMAKSFQEASGPKRVEMLTKFGADFYIPGKMLHAFGAACMVIGKQARICRTLEGAASMLAEDLGVAEILDETAQRAYQFELAAQNATVKQALSELMEFEGQISRSYERFPYKIRPFSKIVEKIRAYSGVIPFDDLELLENAKYWFDKFLKEANSKISKKVLQKFKNAERFYEGQMVDVWINAKHIANFEYKVVEDAARQCYKIELMGGHLAGSCKALERAGLVVIKEEKYLRYGCKEFIMENIVTGKTIIKTEFSAGWDLDKILTKAYEAFDNPTVKDSLNIKDRLTRIGRTEEGLLIELILDPNPMMNVFGDPVRPHDISIITIKPYFD